MRASPGGGGVSAGPLRAAAVPWRRLCRASRPLRAQELPLSEGTVALWLLHPRAPRGGHGALFLVVPALSCTGDFGTRSSPAGIQDSESLVSGTAIARNAGICKGWITQYESPSSLMPISPSHGALRSQRNEALTTESWGNNNCTWCVGNNWGSALGYLRRDVSFLLCALRWQSWMATVIGLNLIPLISHQFIFCFVKRRIIILQGDSFPDDVL
jgi:hypothetical protein